MSVYFSWITLISGLTSIDFWWSTQNPNQMKSFLCYFALCFRKSQPWLLIVLVQLQIKFDNYCPLHLVNYKITTKLNMFIVVIPDVRICYFGVNPCYKLQHWQLVVFPSTLYFKSYMCCQFVNYKIKTKNSLHLFSNIFLSHTYYLHI